MKKILILAFMVFLFSVYAESDGQVLVNEDLAMEREFYISDISNELLERMQGKTYKDECTVPVSELRYIHIMHKTLDGSSREGELVSNAKIAQLLLEIFKELYKADYPIEKIRLVDEYDANDEKSMADNNSSCFNFRFISFTRTVSKHGIGLAVDINPLYNPYIKMADGALDIEPSNSAPYVDRTAVFPYKIDHNDLAYKLFISHGFEWGGDWDGVKDYQHFEFAE